MPDTIRLVTVSIISSLKTCRIYTFFLLSALRESFESIFQNNCYTATTSKRIEDIKRYLKIMIDNRGSSCGSSWVAVGSSWVAVEALQIILLPRSSY